MIDRRATRFIRRVLYDLKRLYGFDLTFHKEVSEVNDLKTGEVTPTIITQRVRRAIVLPGERQWKFEYDLAFIAAAKNFTYGGLYDTSNRRLIIDKQDLKGYVIELSDYVIWDEVRWEVARIFDFELQTGYIVEVKQVSGTVRGQVTEITLDDTISFSQEIT